MEALPTLRQLTYLSQLAEHLNFRRAAEAAGVTQSTLSAAIRDLEAVLGVTVVERDRRGVVLTPMGEEVLRQGDRLLRQARAMTRLGQGGADGLSGPLDLGIIPTIGPFVLDRLIPAAGAQVAGAPPTWREDTTHRLLGGVMDGTLDAAVLAFPIDAPNVDWVALIEDPLLYVFAPDRIAAPGAGGAVPAAEILDGPGLILPADGHCLRAHTLALCPTRVGRGAPTAVSLASVAAMVAQGQGAAVLPKIAVEAGLVRGLPVQARPIAAEPPATRTIGLAWRRGERRDRAFRRLAAQLSAALSPTGAPT